jgi:hypothetical protein
MMMMHHSYTACLTSRLSSEIIPAKNIRAQIRLSDVGPAN